MADKEADETPGVANVAGPKEPLHYTAPTVASVTGGVPAPTEEGEAVDYESMTVHELKDLAAKRGVDIPSDARKDDIIQALKSA